jgi:hypothetical protein
MTQQTPSKVLYDLLVTRNFNPTALPGEKTDDSSNDVSYKFDYKAQSGKDYGTAVAMINPEGLTLYFGDNLGKGMESSDKDGWFNFLGQLKNLAMSNRLNGFHIQDLSKLKYSIQGQAAIKEGLFESWAGTKTRAPEWFSNNNLEWLYRLYQEPWRWKRMLSLPHFVWCVTKDSLFKPKKI